MRARYNTPKDCSTCYNATSNWGSFQGRAAGTRGFDIDAKVQVFETTIRGLGGLLSAHLFATNALPSLPKSFRPPFAYKNELLYLAEDLGRRLLPALTDSPTGIPYPRINLRHGLPNSIQNPRYYTTRRRRPGMPTGKREHASEAYWRHPLHPPPAEIPSEETTNTCTAGAGSLVLEFTLLSRLTDNPIFETAAKTAFGEVWRRRSELDLVGTGINAESGQWEGANSGVGAGVDSFFEYAFKSYILLAHNPSAEVPDLDESYFQYVWRTALAALKQHALVSTSAVWWNNINLSTGNAIPGVSWIDSLGAFLPGVLSADTDLDLAIRGHLTYASLWAHYGALPERYNTKHHRIESGLSWYPGRPEHIESTYLLYRATRDPLLLHHGEQIMRDLTARCRTRCGWAGLQNVETGEQQDRMESFWLSETWKYLFLLFDDAHPLHGLDAPWVFTTEGHPIVLPARNRSIPLRPARDPAQSCPRPPDADGFNLSPLANRGDLFHAAAWLNSTFALPAALLDPHATSAPLPEKEAATTLQFPGTLPVLSVTPFSRAGDTVTIHSLSGLTFTLLASRIAAVGGSLIGKEERVLLPQELLGELVLDDVFWVGEGRGWEGVFEREDKVRKKKNGGARGFWQSLVRGQEEEVVRVLDMEGDGGGVGEEGGWCGEQMEVGGCEVGGRRICEGKGEGCEVWVKEGELEMLREGKWRVKMRRKVEVRVQGKKVHGVWIT